MGRDAELNIVGHDHTGAATRSAGNNFDQLRRKVNRVNDSSSKATSGLAGMAEELKGLSTTIRAAGPLGAITALTAAIGFLPVIGSIAANGLVLAMGGGLVAIGVLAAAQNAKVRRAFQETFAYVKSVAPQLGAPFVPVLVKLAERIKSTFALFAPELTKSMQTLAPVVDRFLGNVQAGVMQLRPIIGPVTAAFAALVDAIGPQVPLIMQQLAAALTNVANAVRQNPQAFATLIAVLGRAIAATLNFIAVLTRLWGAVNRNRDFLRPIVVGLLAMNPVLALVSGTFTRAMNTILRGASNMAAGFLRAISSMISGAARAADAVGLDGAAKRLRGNAGTINALADGIQRKINSLTGKTVDIRVNTIYKVYKPKNSPGAGFGGGGLMLSSAAGWSPAVGSFRAEPPVVNVAAPSVTTILEIDGQQFDARVRTIVGEMVGRAAGRARVGRAR